AFLGRGARRAEAALLLPVVFVSLTAARHMPFFAIAAAPYLAAEGPAALAWLARLAGISARVPDASPARSSWQVDGAAAALAVLDRRGVRALLLRPTDAAAVRARETGWTVVASGPDFVLLARP